jgi:hypothetical protein
MGIVMHLYKPNSSDHDERLSDLAMEFCGTRVFAERQKIATMYAETVDRLIEIGQWDELPAPEDQLPEAWMPRSFFDYWSRRESTGPFPGS